MHGYGGGSFTVGTDGGLVFTDWNRNGVFSLKAGHVRPIIDGSGTAFGDFDVHKLNPYLILAVQERAVGLSVHNEVVLIDSRIGSVTVVAEGADFYAHPRFNNGGNQLCWTQWSHPDMSWTGSELYLADWINGTVKDPKLVAGKAGTESICQPRWGEDGSLFFVSDRTGFWQIYRLEKGEEASNAQHLLLQGFENADFAGAENMLGRFVH